MTTINVEPGRRGPTDVAAFGARLGNALTLIATISGEPVGFGSLKGADVIDMLYCRSGIRQAWRRRHADRRVDRGFQKGRGAKQLTSEVSDTAPREFREAGFCRASGAI